MMKQLLILFSAFVLVACRKETNEPDRDYSTQVQSSLPDHLQDEDFASLHFAGARTVQQPYPDSLWCVIPVKPRPMNGHTFLVASTDRSGAIGQVLYLSLLQKEGSTSVTDGRVLLKAADHRVLFAAEIREGVVQKKPSVQATAIVPGAKVLPEVVVVGYTGVGGVDYADWISLPSILALQYGGSYSGGGNGHTPAYIPLDYIDRGGSMGNGGTIPMETEELEPTYVDELPGIDLKAYFKCFDAIPSAGASYSVTLHSDIPNNKNPHAMLNIFGGGVGHCFLSVTKMNGTARVTQTFGFFFAEKLSFAQQFPTVRSRMIDNGGRESNASISMSLSPVQFDQLLSTSIVASTAGYNLQHYNCADYALKLFNMFRASPLSVASSDIHLPAINMAPAVDLHIGKSPQAIFSTLQHMKTSGHPEASQIIIDQTHDRLSPKSHGPC